VEAHFVVELVLQTLGVGRQAKGPAHSARNLRHGQVASRTRNTAPA
jgi:hypothetical protein